MGHSYRKRAFIKDITSACHRVVSIQLPRNLVLRGVNSTCKETALTITGPVVKARVRLILRGDRFCEVFETARISQKSKASCRRARELSIVNVKSQAHGRAGSTYTSSTPQGKACYRVLISIHGDLECFRIHMENLREAEETKKGVASGIRAFFSGMSTKWRMVVVGS